MNFKTIFLAFLILLTIPFIYLTYHLLMDYGDWYNMWFIHTGCSAFALFLLFVYGYGIRKQLPNKLALSILLILVTFIVGHRMYLFIQDQYAYVTVYYNDENVPELLTDTYNINIISEGYYTLEGFESNYIKMKIKKNKIEDIKKENGITNVIPTYYEK